MEKFKYVFLFLLITLLSFSKDISSIKDMTLEVEEKLTLNGEIKKSEYILKYIKPDFIRKEIISPELNKGEIYIYNSEKKMVYLPLFDQVSESKLEDGEDDIAQTINYILKEKSKLVEGKIRLKNGGIVELKKIKNFSGYDLPEYIIIYDGDIKVAELKVKGYKINTNLDREALSLHD